MHDLLSSKAGRLVRPGWLYTFQPTRGLIRWLVGVLATGQGGVRNVCE